MKYPGNKRGGLSLEAAVVMPFILLLTASMIVGIRCIEAEIIIKGALDRTAAELALLTPAGRLHDIFSVSAGERDLPIEAQTEQELSAIWQDLKGEGLLADLTLDFTSTALAGPAIHRRLNDWLTRLMGDRRELCARVGERKLFLDWKLKKNQLWLCLSYKLKTPIMTFEKSTWSVVPLWLGRQEETNDAEASEIWMLDNFSRGKRFRTLFGAYLPDDFPVIARFEQGEAVMIKSIDLTAPTYQNQRYTEQHLERMIGRLAEFSGASYRKKDVDIQINAGMISQKRLIVIIPANSSKPFWDTIVADLINRAEADQIRLQVVRYGKSARYQTSSASGTN